jgi:hypothetical protein
VTEGQPCSNHLRRNAIRLFVWPDSLGCSPNVFHANFAGFFSHRGERCIRGKLPYRPWKIFIDRIVAFLLYLASLWGLLVAVAVRLIRVLSLLSSSNRVRCDYFHI